MGVLTLLVEFSDDNCDSKALGFLCSTDNESEFAELLGKVCDLRDPIVLITAPLSLTPQS